MSGKGKLLAEAKLSAQANAEQQISHIGRGMQKLVIRQKSKSSETLDFE